MALTTVGKVLDFHPASDSVSAHEEQAQLFLEANETAEAKQVTVFLSAIRGRTYAFLHNIL